MPALRTEITEIVTGLAMLGAETLDDAMSARPCELVGVDDPTWERLAGARHDRAHDRDFLAAWNNGRAFLAARDGLRGRRPIVIEWKGGHRDPGDTSVPSDLRVDHVYLVSCKYLSKVLHNASPWALFSHHLVGALARRNEGDWFDAVAPREHQELYRLVRQRYGADLGLPEAAGRLSTAQRRLLRARIPRDWDEGCQAAYAALVEQTSGESTRRWAEGLGTARDREMMLWRLLRLTPAPYFVLGTSAAGSLRLRVDTPWDFTRAHKVHRLDLLAGTGGQATVEWSAVVTDRSTGDDRSVRGHVEVRWSHGRFGGPPEAKVYLDTPHERVPGYVALR
ncbi:MAG: hypothetical protein V9E94_00705 [Microthrixaceae bacterium]